MRERRDAKKKQEQEAVENKLRRIQLRESFNFLKSMSFVEITERHFFCCDTVKFFKRIL